jgi:hypothetical protein
VLPTDPEVTREEWSLLALVDGRRSVTELVDLTGSGQYAVVSTLAALVQRGLLEVRPESGEAEDHVAVVMRRQRLLATLEDAPFVPVQETKTQEAPPAKPAGKAAKAIAEAASGSSASDSGDSGDSGNAGHEGPSTPDAGADGDDRELATAKAGADGPVMLGGAHVPQDVVPPRPEPFLPKRQADFEEPAPAPAVRAVHVQAGPSASMSGLGDVVGATATAPDPDAMSVIERDPNVNRSLMLRLIAGVRGL